MENTTNLKMPLLVPNQSGKEITHNEALVIIDNILQNGIIDKDLTTPPSSPNSNDIYIVGASATGAWSGKDKQIAFYDNGWRFIEAREGFTFWVNDENKLYSFDGSNWIQTLSTLVSTQTLNDLTDITISSVSQYDILQHNGTNFVNTKEVQNLSLLGVNTTANSINKLSVKSDSVLFDNATDDSRVKVNKATSTDTASHLFQSNYSGRAEFGLIGDDNFTLKVSSDGTNWNDSFVVDKSNGNVEFKQNLTFSSTAKETIQSLGMPSTTYVNLSITLGINNYGIAPANGYIILQVKDCSHYRVWNNTVSSAFGIWNYQGNNMNYGSGFVPIAKGQQWGIFTQDGTIAVARFYYLTSSSNN